VLEAYVQEGCVHCRTDFPVEVRLLSKEEARKRGAFGSPTYWLVKEGKVLKVYFGPQERQIKEDIKRWCG